MADDNQRLTRNPYSRTPLKSASGNDPLAELARLIGQTDPFAEFGHKPTAPAQAPAQHWPQQAGHSAHAPEQYAHAPADAYPATQHAGYHEQYAAAEYDSNAYYQDDVAGAKAHHDYDDVPPPRRRTAMLAIAAVVMLAVVGTAGAYGYRALFGSTGSSPPPVIKADTTPTKVVPSAKTESSSNKLIYDRVGNRNNTAQEKIVSREEQPVEIKDAKPGQISLFPSAVGNASVTPVSASPADQPKKIHTIAIRPDQPIDAPAAASIATAAAKPPPAKPVAQASAPPVRPAAAPQRLASAPPAATADAEEAPPPPRPAPTRPAAAPHNANAPLSLSPTAASPAPAAAPQPARTASIPPSTAGVGAPSVSGQYAVQVSSQRSEAEAQAAFRSLQGKFPGQLGGRQPLIRRADLGSKGIYYRAMVGPFVSSSEATELCQSLKSAGGSCLIQKN